MPKKYLREGNLFRVDTPPIGLYLYPGVDNSMGGFQRGRLLPVTATFLDEVRERIGCDILLATPETVVVSTLFAGRPVIDLPRLSLWDARYLLRRLGGGAHDADLSDGAARTLLSHLWLRKPRSSLPTVCEIMLNLGGHQTALFGYDPAGLDVLVPYARVWTPLPRDPRRPAAHGAPLSAIMGILQKRDHSIGGFLPVLPVKYMFYAFPPDLGGRPDMGEGVNTKWTPEWSRALAEELDWRPSEPLDPLNLFTASPGEIRSFLDRLAVRDAEGVAAGLGRYLGPAGEAYSSSNLKTIEGLSPDDAEILAGLLYRRDPALDEAARAFLAAAPVPGATVRLGGREYVLTSAGEIGRGVRLLVLVDRTSFLAEVQGLRTAGYGAVLVVFVVSLVGLQIFGTTLLAPIRRLDAAMRRVAGGDLTATVPAFGRDEFARFSAGFNAMLDGLRQKTRLEGSFRRYVPEAVVREAGRADSVVALGGDVRTCSILFADVRGFTRASQTLPAAEVVRLLNEFFAPVVEEVQSSGGTVDKFIGDAVLAVWGAPEAVEDYADRAVSAAVRIQERVLAMNRAREEKGLIPLYFGIGIASGEVLAGHVGTPERADWTVIGQEVNLAQRISAFSWPYRIRLSEKTARSLRRPKDFTIRQDEEMRLKGFEHAVKTFVVLWHDGHSGPMLEEDRAGEWYAWNGEESRGPNSLTDLVRLPGFSAETLVSRSGSDWIPWWKAARNFTVWSIMMPDGPKGLFTLDEIAEFAGNSPDSLVRLQGDPGWRALKNFLGG